MKLNRQGRPYLGLFQERKEIELNSAETQGGFVFFVFKGENIFKCWGE